MDLLALLASIQKKYASQIDLSGHGIGLAIAYFAATEGVGGAPWTVAGTTQKAWESAKREATCRFTYTDQDTIVKGGVSLKNAKSFGAPSRKDNDLTPGSILDFEGIATSRTKDRQGDVVEPAGAEFDPNQALLLHHNPTLPVGKLCGVLQQNNSLVLNHWSMADTPLATDNAPLVEMGAYRLSIGFSPKVFKSINQDSEHWEDEGRNGWLIEKCYVAETSLVTIPAQEDAIITQVSRAKFHTDYMKAWGQKLWDLKPVTVKSGYDLLSGGRLPIHLTVNIHPEKEKKVEPTEDDTIVKTPPAAAPAPTETPAATPPAATPVAKKESVKNLLAQLKSLTAEADVPGDVAAILTAAHNHTVTTIAASEAEAEAAVVKSASSLNYDEMRAAFAKDLGTSASALKSIASTATSACKLNGVSTQLASKLASLSEVASLLSHSFDLLAKEDSQDDDDTDKKEDDEDKNKKSDDEDEDKEEKDDDVDDEKSDDEDEDEDDKEKEDDVDEEKGDDVDANDDGVEGWDGKSAEQVAHKLMAHLAMDASPDLDTMIAVKESLDEAIEKHLADIVKSAIE